MIGNEIKSKVIAILAKLLLNTEVDADILEYVNLIDDLGIDSLTFISIVVEVESVFGITVPDEMLLMEHFRNVDQIVQIIETAKCADKENAVEKDTVG